MQPGQWEHFPGLRRQPGSKRFLNRAIISSVSGANWWPIISIFSIPMPVSPVMERRHRYSAENFIARLPDAIELAGHMVIEQNERVQIAVAGVKNIADEEAVAVPTSWMNLRVGAIWVRGRLHPGHSKTGCNGRRLQRRSCVLSIAGRAPER